MRKVLQLVYFLAFVNVALASALYDSKSDVVLLTDNNFEEEVLQSGGLWIVEFYADWCGHCKSFAPEYLKAAKALKGLLKVGAVESAQKNTMSKYDIKGFPTIKIFGADKSKPTEYTGGRTAESVIKTLTKHVEKSALDKLGLKSSSSSSGSSGHKTDGDVVILTDDNFDDVVLKSQVPVFVKFFSPQCGHCRNMAGDWKEAATKLKDSAIVAELDVTQNSQKSQEYQIRGYPTMKLFYKDINKKQKIEDYNGNRDSNDFVDFVFDKTNIPRPQANKDMKFQQLNSHDEFESECMSKKLCVLLFLPQLEDSSPEERKKLLQTVESVMKSTSPPTWAWFYTDGLVNEAFERALGFIDVAYPVLTSIHPGKHVSLPMLKSITESNLKAYIGELVTNKVRSQAISKVIPKFTTIPEKDEL